MIELPVVGRRRKGEGRTDRNTFTLRHPDNNMTFTSEKLINVRILKLWILEFE